MFEHAHKRDSENDSITQKSDLNRDKERETDGTSWHAQVENDDEEDERNEGEGL